MRILGIDPGFERLGIAILEKNSGERERVLFSECFKTPSDMAFVDRLETIGKHINSVIEEWQPQMLAIETLFLNTNQKTAMRVSEVRGAVIYLAKSAGLDVFEASPPQIKMAVAGFGRAGKNEIIKMVKLLLKIDNKGKKDSDDELDAMAVAITAFAHKKNVF